MKGANARCVCIRLSCLPRAPGVIARGTTMKIAEFLSPVAVVSDLSGQSKPEILRELCDSLARSTPALKTDRLVEVLQEREKLGSTGIGEGVAIPHGKLGGLSQLMASFGVSRGGVDF